MQFFKSIIFMLSFILSSQAPACQCGSIGLGTPDIVESVIDTVVYNRISDRHHTRIDFDKDMREIKAYPNAWEVKHRREFEGSSCGYAGPQGEALYNCHLATKSDYEILVKQQNCKINVQVEANAYSIKAKIIDSTCNLVDL